MRAIERHLRSWFRPLRKTPLHPQWFAFRGEHGVRRWIRENASGQVLDIGCADRWAREVLNSGCSYVGLDYPGTAATMYATKPDVFADGARLPFSEQSMDTVLLLEVLEHVQRPMEVLAEISRVLRPGGLLLLTMPFLYPLHDAPHDYQRLTEPGLRFALKTAGLRVESLTARNSGFEGAALIFSVACAEDAILAAIRRPGWRLLFVPLLLLAVPVINLCGWSLSILTGSQMVAGGHAVRATKP